MEQKDVVFVANDGKKTVIKDNSVKFIPNRTKKNKTKTSLKLREAKKGE